MFTLALFWHETGVLELPNCSCKTVPGARRRRARKFLRVLRCVEVVTRFAEWKCEYASRVVLKIKISFGPALENAHKP